MFQVAFVYSGIYFYGRNVWGNRPATVPLSLHPLKRTLTRCSTPAQVAIAKPLVRLQPIKNFYDAVRKFFIKKLVQKTGLGNNTAESARRKMFLIDLLYGGKK